jgi:hypothetical protein
MLGLSNSQTVTAQGHSRAFIKGAWTSMAMKLHFFSGFCPFVQEFQAARHNEHNSELEQRIFNAGNHSTMLTS